MAVRLRPQSAAWMAPHALAAQLTAQTGQIAGQGVAGLLGGIAQGVGAFTQKREARRAEAINESRYQDSIARQDRAFKYGAAQDQMALAQRYAQGLEVKAQGELASKGTVDPSTVAELQKIASSMKALSAQGAQIGGVQAADIPDVDYSKMAASQPQGGDGYSRDDMIRLAKSMRGMSDEELSGVLSFYTANEQAASAALNSRKVEGAEAFRLRTEAGNYKMLSMLAKNEADSRSEASKLKSKQAEADIEAGKQIKVKAEDTKAKKVDEAAAIATLQESLKAKGIDVTLPNDLESARKEYEDAVIKAPIRKEKKAQFDAKREDASTRFDRVMKVRERGVKVQEDRANKPSDKDPNEQKVKLFKMHLAASEAASNRYDFADAEAEDIKANLILKELEDAYKGDAPSASAYPSWLPSDPAAKSEWDALSPEAKQKVINQRGR